MIPAITKLVKTLVERLGGLGELLRIFKENRQNMLRESLRTYLARFGMDQSLFPCTGDHMLKNVFTAPATPLNLEHLNGVVSEQPPAGESGLIDPDRTSGDYFQVGIDVRLTRANYRTGRLEISGYLSQTGFIDRYHLQESWVCQRTACIYHQQHRPHGAKR